MCCLRQLKSYSGSEASQGGLYLLVVVLYGASEGAEAGKNLDDAMWRLQFVVIEVGDAEQRHQKHVRWVVAYRLCVTLATLDLIWIPSVCLPVRRREISCRAVDLLLWLSAV